MKKVFLSVLLLVLVVAGSAFAWRWQMIQELRKPLLADLTDPDSAMFRNEMVVSPWDSSDVMYCGEFNAKNQMGGYAGYKSFQVNSGNDRRPEPLVIWWASLCEDYKDEAAWWWVKW